MKQCIYCGAQLPDEASFCPVCAKSQAQKKEASTPKIISRKWWILPSTLFIVVLVIVGIYLYNRPKIYEDQGKAEIVYHHRDRTYHVLLRNSFDDQFHWHVAQTEYNRELKRDMTGVMPLQLYVYEDSDKENAAEEFLTLVKDTEVTIRSASGAKTATIGDVPSSNPAFVNAALVVDVIFDIECQDNTVTWTIHMKNGDTLVLNEDMVLRQRRELFYSYEDTPLETTEDLQALLDKIDEEVDSNVSITITLAPLTYHGTVRLSRHVVHIEGTTEADAQTILQGTILIDDVDANDSSDDEIVNIHFVGEPDSNGIDAAVPFFAKSCTFTGYDLGINAKDGCWPMPSDCVFENCRIGLYVNSGHSASANYWFDGLTFRNNETGVLLEKMPSNMELYFTNCIYEGNGTDMDNRAGNTILDSY